MNNDRTRPLLEAPAYHSVPASWVTKYLQSKVEEYRHNNPLFDEYLSKTHEEIVGRDLSYCGNVLIFLEGKGEANWISPSKSLFKTFIKLFNYDFSVKQTVDYIEKCHEEYDFLLNNELKVSDTYSIFTKTCSWDGNTRDFVNLSLEPVKASNKDCYWINVDICSLQDVLGDPDHFGDNKIEFKSDKAIYEDALVLFDYYQGSTFLNKCLKFAISKLIQYRVIDKPVKVTYEYSNALFYSINKHLTFKLKQEEREDDLL